MEKYYLASESGVRVQAVATTLTGAKREASKWMSFGGKSVYVEDSHGNTICMRLFWQSLNLFGWEKWETV